MLTLRKLSSVLLDQCSLKYMYRNVRERVENKVRMTSRRLYDNIEDVVIVFIAVGCDNTQYSLVSNLLNQPIRFLYFPVYPRNRPHKLVLFSRWWTKAWTGLFLV